MDNLMAASGMQGPPNASAMQGSGSVDSQRARAYATAQRVDAVLSSTSKTLEGLIERVNSEHKARDDDPVRIWYRCMCKLTSTTLTLAHSLYLI